MPYKIIYRPTPAQSERAARSRVKSGAKWLDESFPGWETRIDTESLDLGSAYNCVCGQLFEPNSIIVHNNADWRINGYDFAFNNLFTEANSWITTLVGLQPLSERSSDKAHGERADRVSIALGFSSGSIYPARWALQAVFVTYEDLEDAWLRLLAERTKPVFDVETLVDVATGPDEKFGTKPGWL